MKLHSAVAVLLALAPCELASAQCPGWSAVPGLASDASVTESVVFDDGSGPALYVSGTFTAIGGTPALHVARWDGEQWSAVGGGIADHVRVLSVYDDGNGPCLVAGGSSATPGGPAPVWRLEDGAWITIGNLQPNIDGFAFVLALCGFDDGTGPKLYAGGGFEGDVLAWDGSTWTEVGGGLAPPHLQNEPQIHALAVHDDGLGGGPTLYAGGLLHARDWPWEELSDNVARLQNGLWTSVGNGLGNTSNSLDRVSTIHTYDDGTGPKLYAGGTFAFPGIRIAQWDGSSWTPVGGGVNQNAWSHVIDLDSIDDGSGSRLVVAGAFSQVGGQAAGSIATWDGANWGTLAGGMSEPAGHAPVHSVSTFDAGSGRGPELFAAGSFTAAGGVPAQSMARWSGCGGTSTTFCHGDGSATPCPCGNASPAGARAGCLHSFGVGATLRVHGRASLSDDSLVLAGASMPDSSALYYQGANLVNGGAGVVFGDGLKCTAGPFIRLRTYVNQQGASSHPGPNDLSLSVQGLVTVPGTRYYQIRYRNSATFCTSETFNYSNGVAVIWGA